MKPQEEHLLNQETLREVHRAYAEIRAASGYGKIAIRIERAGELRESHFVAVENERKTK